ncbi:SGNH hydrolase [Aspergillus affinis]|uniref:SGNH hydrolase n=1 Tax=Aspergillus affinis TaxID=1070780 RepID=UPI0022FEFC05|nr:SGNH hydrolase [Aspergillus affinis]KAI9041495.1 SGNH hydrolase [Aspergillus affinis]
MAPLAWSVLLLVLLGHTISAVSLYPRSDVSDADIGLSSNVPPVGAPLDLDDTLTSDAPVLEPREDKRDDHDPKSFEWIRRWAALGDSFTAGIGAGNLFNGTEDDIKCSRYDRSYPARLKLAFPEDADFQYLACSGDRTEQIHAQTMRLKEGQDLDLVILTGGGNDLCLSDIIKRCVLMPFQSDKKCDEALERADNNLEHLLTDNIRSVLAKLDGYVRRNGLVLYVLYAEFFNTDLEKCGLNQDWTLGRLGEALPLTKKKRQKFNSLVTRTNDVIRKAIDAVVEEDGLRYRIRTVDWNEFPKSGVRGQFCQPGTKGMYPDPGQPDLQFFKTNTAQIQDIPPYTGEGKRDVAVEQAEDRLWYSSRIYKSINPVALAERHLDPRAPLPPHCPGDREKADENQLEEWLKDAIESWGFGLPDGIGKLFHPNELGHATIASFAMQELINARSEELGTYNPRCENFNKFECNKKGDEWSNYYANVDSAVQARNTFCKGELPLTWKEVAPGRYKHRRTYFRDTPDEVHFEVISRYTSFNRDECHDSFDRIIHSCDGLDPENPLNFKYGGRWNRGENVYQLTMGGGHIKRIKEVPKKRTGHCAFTDVGEGYRFFLQGSGFRAYDFGQYSVWPAAQDCGQRPKYVHSFDFHYFPTPEDGMEWQAAFSVRVKESSIGSGVQVVARCSGIFTTLGADDIPCYGLHTDKDKADWNKPGWKHDEL